MEHNMTFEFVEDEPKIEWKKKEEEIRWMMLGKYKMIPHAVQRQRDAHSFEPKKKQVKYQNHKMMFVHFIGAPFFIRILLLAKEKLKNSIKFEHFTFAVEWKFYSFRAAHKSKAKNRLKAERKCEFEFYFIA